MTWRVMLLAVLAISLVPSISASDVGGQAIDWLSGESGMIVARDPGSARLDGMGGLQNVIGDEGRELNLSDYGRNLSARLWDSDSRLWETWFHSVDRVEDSFSEAGDRNRIRDDQLETGGRMTWRSGGKQFLGLDISFDQFDHQAQFADNSKVRGPWWGGFIGRSVGRITASAAVHFVSDNEDILTDDVFAIRHQSTGMQYVGSLAYRRETLAIGLQGEYQTNTITGLSRDESRFHEDKLTWRRPAEIYSASLVWSPWQSLKGMVRGRVMNMDGREESEISWSDRMPQNPGRENFTRKVGTFKEEISGSDFGTRWEARLFESLTLAGELETSTFEDEVQEGKNFKGSRRDQDEKDTVTRALGGFGFETLAGRLRVGLEGGMSKLTHEESDIMGDIEVTSRNLELRTGAEYFVTDMIALRGGYVRMAQDDDLDEPRTLGLGNGFTFGIGYFPRGGLVQLDAAVRIYQIDPDYDGFPSVERSGVDFSLGARFLL